MLVRPQFLCISAQHVEVLKLFEVTVHTCIALCQYCVHLFRAIYSAATLMKVCNYMEGVESVDS
jgi:hypothetical protein